MFTAQEAKEAVELYEQKKKSAIVEQALKIIESDIVPNIIANANRGLRSVSFTDKVRLFRTQAVEEAVVQKLREGGYEVDHATSCIRIFWMK